MVLGVLLPFAGPLLRATAATAFLYSIAIAESEWSKLDASVHLLISSSSRSASADAGVGDSDAQSDAAWDLGPSRDMLGYHALLCTLPMCRTAGPDAPLLFVNEFTDGVGHRIRGIFGSIALASKLQMNFGGILKGPNDWVHDLHATNAIQRWFGFKNDTQLYINKDNTTVGNQRGHRFFPELEEPPQFKWNFTQEYILEKERSKIEDRSKVLLNAPQIGHDKEGKRLTEGFLAEMRKNLEVVPRSEFKSDGVHVAMHVRRGDYSRKDAERLAPDKWFLDVKRRISRALLQCDQSPAEPPPRVDFHAWSSIENEGIWKLEDFRAFQDAGMNVHLDSKDILSPLAHFAFADVLVLPGHTRSHFSMIAAFLNSGCLVTPLSEPLYKELGALNPERKSFEEDLRACVSTRRKSKWSCTPREEEPALPEHASAAPDSAGQDPAKQYSTTTPAQGPEAPEEQPHPYPYPFELAAPKMPARWTVSWR